jgi:hypothetical protein
MLGEVWSVRRDLEADHAPRGGRMRNSGKRRVLIAIASVLVAVVAAAGPV